MNSTLCGEALEVGAMVRERIEVDGGVDVLRRCVSEPSLRAGVGDMLGELGIWDIDPSAGSMELEAAAEVCRAAGHYVLPYPVVERLGATGAQATALVAQSGHRLMSHLDLELTWNAVDLTGQRYQIQHDTMRPLQGAQLAPFGAGVQLVAEPDAMVVRETATLSILQSWWLLGLLENAVEDTSRYTREREQFGNQLAQFQAVAFRLADMALEVQASSELAKYALWLVEAGAHDDDVLVEALGLRVAMQRAASVVLRGAHQLHGAMGFTDEVDVSWLSRASQTVLRIPEDTQRTLGLLLSSVERVGYSELGRSGAARP